MDTILAFLKNNYEWLLSGIFTSFIFYILGFFKGRNSVQKQKIGNNSRGIQVRGNYTSNRGKSR
ncbi:hypothetical protein CLFO_15190 [Clostridium formicaceticum]|uniref:Uncharacterized protein n=1 Tax=Clostridium formicaceticum TaxID=1497 RepID=A0AAC9WFS6_9CLOT|nr:hypothetical protein BJL90_12980 [Clostridium formicaceticum]ARE87133.1 hypothetical protein CLFO_15190 [Clostridium formicaceticum]